MVDEEKKENTEVVEDESVEIIKNLKANSVSKDEYEKLQKRNNELMKALANGTYQPEKIKEPSKEDRDKEYYDNIKALGTNKEQSNLEVAKRLLKLNDDRIARGEGMIGIPTKGTPTAEILEGVERTWDLMRYAVEKANGSEGVYNAIIQDHLQDNNLIKVR